MIIGAFAKAHKTLILSGGAEKEKDSIYLKAAISAANFIKNTLTTKEGHLLRNYRSVLP